MKPLTKYIVYGGIATAVLGPTLVAQTLVSVGVGAGTFTGITIEDGLPALTDGFQNYEGGETGGLFGETGGLFGETAPDVPLGVAPGGPLNP